MEMKSGEDQCEGEANEGSSSWRRKCISLQKQVEMLTAANRLLGKQLQEKTAQVRKLMRNGRDVGGAQTSFSVFPEELWEIILQYVGDSQDLLNVCRTSNQLDTVLHPAKGTWMFALILEHVFKLLNKEDILRCRLVCKKWSSAIDKFLERHPSRLPFSKVHLQDDVLKVTKFSNSAIFHLWDADRIRVLREEMKSHPRNPFVGRCVVFNVEIDDDFDDEEEELDDPGIVEFWDLTRMFLMSVGHHIWYVEITEDSGHQKPLEFYKLLREILAYLPNLKSLKLAVDISHEDYHPKALPLYMANNPLPVMPHLESLDVECFYPEVPQIIHDMLIAMYSSQLSKLHLNMSRWKNGYSRGLLKLTELHLKEVSLGRLSLLHAPHLGKVCLDLRGSLPSLSASSPCFSTHCLFETLSRFPTLRVLKLIVDIAVELEEIGSTTSQSYSIPSLQQLEIYGIQRKINYSFLLCFPSLKYMTICESTSANKFNEDPAVIAFLEGDSQSCVEIVELQKFMYTGRMYESNIWRQVPSLQIFSFERIRYGDLIFRHKCSREIYEYRNRTAALLTTTMTDKNELPIETTPPLTVSAP